MQRTQQKIKSKIRGNSQRPTGECRELNKKQNRKSEATLNDLPEHAKKPTKNKIANAKKPTKVKYSQGPTGESRNINEK